MLFNYKGITGVRIVWMEELSGWYYSVVDVVACIINQKDELKARKYWNKLKSRLTRYETKLVRGESGIAEIELVIKILKNCHQFKMSGKDSKLRMTDAMDIETLDMLIKFIPSPHTKEFTKKLVQIEKEIKNPSFTIQF